jgi:hypothetical protein
MRWPAVTAFLLLCSCGSFHREQTNRVILPPSDAPELLKQCSRDTPAMGGTWEPAEADVDQLEAVLPGRVAALPQAHDVDFSHLLQKWHRQYAGIERGGRRYIYGNFFPVDQMNELANWRKGPLDVCDGGPWFFGVEYDVAAKRVTRIDFNGSVGG